MPGALLLRSLVAYTVLLACVPLFFWLVASRRPPAGVFAPPLLFCAWYAFGGFPLGLVADDPIEHATFGSALQVAVAAATFLQVRSRTGGAWRLSDAHFGPAGVRPLRALALLTLTLVVGLPFLAVQGVANALLAIEQRTDGFIDFGRSGISMTERVYRRDDREVRLVGMMHIGKGDAYRELYRSFERESTVLLQEGVSDDRGRLAAGLDYEPLARALGLDVQLHPEDVLGHAGDEEEKWPHIRHADVDLSEFSPQSIAFLDATAAIISSDDMSAALSGFQEFIDGTDDETWRTIEEDVLHRRNRVVVEALDESLAEYASIVVPWGALHLPAIEAEVLARGFERRAEKRHLLFRYATLFAALAQAAERVAVESAHESAKDQPAAD